ncbi:MAG: hypothetical protein JSV09_05240 [Thermoplasmata archaeon]|nr:MAG: hypothetical protein JSV09_05240 [Thermoplasmata archaeon]
MIKIPVKTDMNKLTVATLLVIVGVCGRILLIQYANIETVLAIALLSGIILGGYYCIVVPFLVMLISDWCIYTFTDYIPTFGLGAIIGLTFFTWSGYVMIGIIGKYIKPRVAYTVRGIAVVVGVGLIATLIYDFWTVIGFWLFLTNRTLGSLGMVFVVQIPFTIYHLMSSLIFVPLFTTIFMYVHEHGMPFLNAIIAPSEERGGTQ